MKVQLIYTGTDMDTDKPLKPEVFATYTEDAVDECRDAPLREMMRATFADGEPRVSGAWSTKVKK